MSYQTGEALVLAQLQAVAGFTSLNTSQSDWLILNSGNSDHYGILAPADAEVKPSGYAINDNVYRTVIQVWQSYLDDGTTLTSLESLIGPIVTRFGQYRKLADTTASIVDSRVTSVSKPEEMWKQNADGPSWLRVSVTIEWIEQEKLVYAE